jgi:hypothetical protein
MWKMYVRVSGVLMYLGIMEWEKSEELGRKICEVLGGKWEETYRGWACGEDEVYFVRVLEN